MTVKVGSVCLGTHFLEWDPTPTNPYNYKRKQYEPRLEKGLVPSPYLRPEDPEEITYDVPGTCPDPAPHKGDLVLCRVNAPLVQMAYGLIRDQVPVKIQGRDIGANLEALIKKLVKNQNAPVEDLLQAIHAYRTREASKLQASSGAGSQRLEAALQALEDKVSCVDALCEGLDTVAQVLSRIQVLFANVKQGDNSAFVLLSSVHKAKGLEAHTVRIIQPELLPHPMARTATQKEQEKNLQYVAYTRALDTLHIH